MDLPSTPSPASAHVLRRRKKRSTPTNNAPGSSLSGLNRSSIRVVELIRSMMGYGFTISGQKPCLLRCIVEGSPAERAGLKPGNCLVGVNGKDVSHLAHDDVVRIIGCCTGLLRLHVADSYFSESSDDEHLKVHQPRPKYPHRPRPPNKKTVIHYPKKLPLLECPPNEKPVIKPIRPSPTTPEPISRCSSPSARRATSTWDPLIPTPRKAPRPPLPFEGEGGLTPVVPVRNQEALHNFAGVSNPNVEIVRVFAHLDSQAGSENSNLSGKSASKMEFPGASNGNDRFNTQSSSGSSARAHNLSSLRKGSPSARSSSSLAAETQEQQCTYQAVVGYIGSVELPEIEEKRRLQALSACVRRLRLEKRVRSIVLLRIQSNGISLFSSSQNVQNGPPLAFYSSSIIAFCGAYSDDRRFFGLVTCTGPNKNSSCHVFMVEPKLLSHPEHLRRARSFGIQCTSLPLPKYGQVLGLQECSEFPATADPILSSILRLYRAVDEQQTQRSPSEASTRLESTNSSNSDSGIGFRDDSDRTSARIYDIVEPDPSLELRHSRRSPALRKRFPMSHRKTTSHQPTCSSNHQSTSQHVCKISPSCSRPKDRTSSRISNPSCFFSDVTDQTGFPLFQSDPNSLKEILRLDESESDAIQEVKPIRRPAKSVSRDRLSLNPCSSTRQQIPRHIEVSVLVTPPRVREKRVSMEQMAPISPGHRPFRTNSTHRVSLTRNGTRSLDNLCSPEILGQNSLEPKGTIGSSTPALNQESVEKKHGGDDFWEFKVPQPPKPKMEINRVEKWAESIEKLLGDSCGMEVFTEFLQREFSAENIHFYSDCLRFKDAFEELTQSQRISMVSTIFQRYLQNGATDPVNVDFQARCQVEKSLSQPTVDMLDLPLSQVFNLLKFDCYPRFLRSDMFRDYASGVTPFPQSVGEASDSDQDSVKSHKLHQDGRRRSLLPWNIKNRSKSKHRSKNDIEGLNSDLSFIQRTAMNQNFDASDPEDGFRRQSYKLCRVILPDNSTTVLPCKPGESLCTVVQRLLEKREFHYSAFEVVSVATGKALKLDMEVSEMSSREIKVEPRAFIGIELPLGWKVGVRANPSRKLSEVLKPILNQHSLKLDDVIVYDVETEEIVDVKCHMGSVDGHNVHVKLKGDSKLEEITNQIGDFGSFDHAYLDDDQTSTKTSSSQTSSVFRGFLRRSSKKYKRKGKLSSHHSGYGGDNISQESGPGDVNSGSMSGQTELESAAALNSNKIFDGENSHPRLSRLAQTVDHPVTESPLSLIPSELNLVENSRNRKPIYIAQSTELSES